MTQMGLDYLKHREQVRHNQAGEAIDSRNATSNERNAASNELNAETKQYEASFKPREVAASEEQARARTQKNLVEEKKALLNALGGTKLKINGVETTAALAKVLADGGFTGKDLSALMNNVGSVRDTVKDTVIEGIKSAFDPDISGRNTSKVQRMKDKLAADGVEVPTEDNTAAHDVLMWLLSLVDPVLFSNLH